MTTDEFRRLNNQTKRQPKKRKHGEHDHQSAYFDVLELNEREFPYLRFIFAVPNAARRSPQVANMMKREGLKAGVWDVHLPFARRGYGAAWLEAKFGDNTLSKAQDAFGAHFRSENYYTHICYSVDVLIAQTEWYLGIELKK